MIHALLSGISHRSAGMDLESSKSSDGNGPKVEKQASVPPLPTQSSTPTQDACRSDAESEASTSNNDERSRMPSGLILKSGRVRLPDKLMEYLNNNVAPDALFWMPEGESFALDTTKAPEQVLNKYFGGTKVASFLRSISRWGFKRVFYHELNKQIYAFHHPQFKRDSPHLEREMKMIVSAPSESKKAKKSKTSRESAQQATKSSSVDARVPVTHNATPAATSQQPITIQLPTMAVIAPSAATPAAPTPASNASLPSIAGQLLGSTLPASQGLNQQLLQRVLQAHQGTTQPIASLGLANFLHQTPEQQLAQLLAPQGTSTTERTGAIFLQQRPDDQLAQLLALQGASPTEAAIGTTTTNSIHADIIRVAMARQLQQQQQQQQQQQAVLNLLTALRNTANYSNGNDNNTNNNTRG